jgi:hypothetical protein
MHQLLMVLTTRRRLTVHDKIEDRTPLSNTLLFSGGGIEKTNESAPRLFLNRAGSLCILVSLTLWTVYYSALLVTSLGCQIFSILPVASFQSSKLPSLIKFAR